MLAGQKTKCIFSISLLCGVLQVVIGQSRYPPDGRIIVHVIQKRSRIRDFITVNRHICPPSLCRTFDETQPDKAPRRRPQGTGGTVFYQGDIVLDEDMDKFIYPATSKLKLPNIKSRRRTKRATMKRKNRLWRNGVVVYKMAKTLSPEAKSVFQRAMKHIMKRTCIRFRPKKNGDKDFIRFISEPGCWSQIGKVGGVQLISLGRGCENLGTAVHEMVHALGVWHEQARPDRDKYVQILEDNISDRFKPDFEMVSKRVSTARGYPYDYSSLMHYSKYAFTRNGEFTIRVKGIGQKLGLKIGQRRGLSTIDISQLRDMYKCNYRVDRNETVCLEGWDKIGVTCYRFFTEPKAQFGPAARKCQGSNKSRLVTLESKTEERLLTKFLDNKWPTIYSWRIAGRKINDRMMWYLGPASAKNITGHTNWAEGQPGSFTSVILKKDPYTKKFKWYGDWVGSSSQKPAFEHAFICEKPARRKCIEGKFADGRDYRGDLDHTREGRTCQKWSENYPHNHTLVDESKEGARRPGGENEWNGLGKHNKCRNPSTMRRNRPWCYTTKLRIEWEYCDISICAKSIKRYQSRLRDGREKSETGEGTIKRKVPPLSKGGGKRPLTSSSKGRPSKNSKPKRKRANRRSKNEKTKRRSNRRRRRDGLSRRNRRKLSKGRSNTSTS